MPTFRYTAKNEEGKMVKGTIDSTSEETARDALKQLNMEPVEVTPLGAVPQAASPPPAASIKEPVQKIIEKAPSPPPPPPPPAPAPVKAVAPAPVKDIPPARALPVRSAQTVVQNIAVKVTPPFAGTVSPSPAPKPAAPVAQSESAEPSKQPMPKRKLSFFSPRKTDEAQAPLQASESPRPRRYATLLSTFRLYAGWLFAWYGLVVALGYYVHNRALSFEIPFVVGLYQSSLVMSFLLATFLFLLVTSFTRMLKGGVVLGIVMSAAGLGAFFLARRLI